MGSKGNRKRSSETRWRIIHYIDSQLYLSHKQHRLNLRVNDTQGVYLAFVLPLCITLSIWTFPLCLSRLYKTSIISSIGISLSALAHICKHCTSSGKEFPFVEIGYITSSMAVSLILVLKYYTGVIFALFISVSISLAYPILLEQLIKACPFSFTYGEATIVTEAFILCISSFAVSIYYHIISTSSITLSSFSIATFTLQSALCIISLLAIFTYKFLILRKASRFLLLTIFLIACFFVAAPLLLFRFDLISWILFLVFSDISAITLVIFWVLCCAVAALIVSMQIQSKKKASTIQRKYFHILLVIVYISGLKFNPCFLYLASGIAFCVIGFIEMIRVLQFPLIESHLQAGYKSFVDEKDTGPLALTPIYLIAGCSASLWLCPQDFHNGAPFSALVGLITVGVGDTVASIAGVQFGRSVWNGTKKTKEGSFFSFLSQVGFFYAIKLSGIMRHDDSFWPIAVLLFATLIEGKTTLIDNLTVPLISYLLSLC